MQDYNLYDAFRARVGSVSYDSLASFVAALSSETNAVEGNPLYQLPTAGDLSLLDSSLAIDAGPAVLPAVFSDFETLFGVALDSDLIGNPRPFGLNVDIGAYEWGDLVFADGFE